MKRKKNSTETEKFWETFKHAIDRSSVNGLDFLMEKHQNSGSILLMLDCQSIKNNNVYHCPLSYCIHTGNAEMFLELYNKGASIKYMEDILLTNGIRPINYICKKGHLELLKIYLPLFIKYHYRKTIYNTNEYTFVNSNDKNLDLFGPAMYSACKAGMLHIVSYVFKYFDEKNILPPKDFDLYSEYKKNGKDSMLVSCYTGNLMLIKYLYEYCNAQFTKLDSNNENALIICVRGFNKYQNCRYLECIEYLVENIGLSVGSVHEKLLKITESPDLIKYFESCIENLSMAHINEKVFKKSQKPNKNIINLSDSGLEKKLSL